jgi:hypothetical protein
MLHQYSEVNINAEPKLLKIWCNDSAKKYEAVKQKTKVEPYKQNSVKKM